MITERQEELSKWFISQELDDWYAPSLINGRLVDYITHPSPSEKNYVKGIWLDADWCFEFFKKLTTVMLFINNQDQGSQITFDSSLFSPEELDVWESITDHGKRELSECGEVCIFWTGKGSLTEQMQELVMEAIKYLPEESKNVIGEL